MSCRSLRRYPGVSRFYKYLLLFGIEGYIVLVWIAVACNSCRTENS